MGSRSPAAAELRISSANSILTLEVRNFIGSIAAALSNTRRIQFDGFWFERRSRYACHVAQTGLRQSCARCE